MLPHEKEVIDEIARKYATHLKAMTALQEAVFTMLAAETWTIPPKKLRGLGQAVAPTMAILLTKANKTFRAVQVLAERGFQEDANVAVRVLMETAVAALFILQKRSRVRTHVFHIYAVRQQLKAITEWARTPGLKRKASKDVVARTTKRLDEMVSKLPKNTNYKGHWSGAGSLQNAVQALRADAMYSTLYRFTSSIAHVSDTGAHIEIDTDGELVYQVYPRAKGFEAPTYAARELLWGLATGSTSGSASGLRRRWLPTS